MIVKNAPWSFSLKRIDFIRNSLFALPFLFSAREVNAKENAVSNPNDIRLYNNDPKLAIKNTGAAYFPLGTHELSALELSSGRLYGPGTIVKAPKAMEAIALSGSVEVEGLTFASLDDRRDGSCEIRLGEGLVHARIQDCNFIGSSYACISADRNGKNDKFLRYKKPASNIKFVNNNVVGNYSRHLYLHSIENLLIQANTFKSSKRDSIRLRQRCRKVQIINNNFENIGTLPVTEKPESSDVLDSYWSGDELIFSHNIIDGCSLHALDLKGIDTHNVIISHNHIKRCGWHGISLIGDSEKNIALKNVLIEGNLISQCNQLERDKEAAALMLSGPLEQVIVKANQLFQNKGRGIMIQNREDKKTINRDFIISANIVHDSKIGIIAFPCDGLILKDNIATSIITREKDRSYKMSRAIIQDNLS